MNAGTDTENRYCMEMKNRTNEELYEVITHEDNYVSEAVQAAKIEINSRQLSPEVLKKLEVKVNENIQKEKTISNMPLQWPIRIIMFIFSFGIIQVFAGEYYRNNGYERKHRECWSYMGYGLIFWICIGVLIGILS